MGDPSQNAVSPTGRPLKLSSSQDEATWLRAVLDALGDGLLVVDTDERVRMINPEYSRITGVSPPEILGKPLSEVRPGAVLPEVLRTGKPFFGVYRKVGNAEYLVDMTPIHIDGCLVGAVSVTKDASEVLRLSEELDRNKEHLRVAQSLHGARYTFGDIIGLEPVLALARRAAETDWPVIISGESGTGKELLAQGIHNAGPRAAQQFVPVNCAAIPSDLLESELFGYEEGAFTSARKGGKMGLFEFAHRGTIFLDEIGDLALDLQAKLLRVLQEGRIRRVGGNREREVDIRVIAATNRDLEGMVQRKAFREDLYFRLNVFHLQIPPLRHRRDEIPRIVQALGRQAGRPDLRVAPEVQRLFLDYGWAGNVRELKHALDYAIHMAAGGEIRMEHLPVVIQHFNLTAASRLRQDPDAPAVPIGAADPVSQADPLPLARVLEGAERQALESAIRRFGRSVEGKRRAARALGISLATLYARIKRLGL